MRVVYFDLDCIRADHLGCYGYQRETSPNIDAVARNAVRFNRCYTSDAPCVPSRAALFSGRFGFNNGVVGNVDTPIQYPPFPNRRVRDREMPMVMRHLRANGVRPISFSNFADRHDAWWYHSGWDEHHLINLRRGFETCDEVNAVALPWFEQHGAEDDYFVHVHYWDNHFPYRSPDMPEWMERFADEPAPEWPDEETIADQHENWYGARTARDLWGIGGQDADRFPWMPAEIRTREDYKKLIDGYDATIYQVDHYIGQILDVLEKQDVLDDTVIIIGGDHGDCFGENGIYMDHYTASEPVLHRPLIVRWPGVTRESTCGELLYLLDLAPTLCDMYGIEKPPLWDGESFIDALRGGDFEGRHYLVCEQSIATVQQAVRTRHHLFVRTLFPGIYPIDEPCWLYDTDGDPYTTNNLADEHPELVERYDHLLEQWKHEQFRKHGPHPDPLDELAERMAGQDISRWLEHFRSTGRERHAEDLIERMEQYRPGFRG
ncbi:MAG: sulfatase [Candidatus Brocadiia bacterium]